MAKNEDEVSIEIRHDFNGSSHHGGRSYTKCHGLAVTLNAKGNLLIFNGLHSKGKGTSIGLCMNSNCIDELIDKLTKMRDDVLIANL